MQEIIAASQAAAVELRAASREANEAAANLRAALREHRELTRQAVTDQVDELIRGYVNRGLDQLGKEIRAFMDQATAKISREIQGLYDTYMRGEQREVVSIPEVMAARQTLRTWNDQGQDPGPVPGEPRLAGPRPPPEASTSLIQGL